MKIESFTLKEQDCFFIIVQYSTKNQNFFVKITQIEIFSESYLEKNLVYCSNIINI